MAEQDLNDFFLIVVASIIFLMQCGFAFLECGAVRSKNATNILLKNILDSFMGFIIYWLIGYALAFGSGTGDGKAFAGDEYFALHTLPKTMYSHFFFHYVFAATAATIVSGAVAERCELVAYFVYSLIITGIIYPIGVHWAWHSNGWLAAEGIEYTYEVVEAVSGNVTVMVGTTAFIDFAGSGVVHLTGGTCALVGAAILGARIGKFNRDGKPRDLKGHSVPLAALGGFILFLGFFFFNGGSQAAIGDGDGPVVALAVVNTIVSGSFAGITTMCSRRIGEMCSGTRPRWSLLNCINGGLTGMVAICAGCNIMEPWAAAITGFIAGLVYVAVSNLVVKARVDDPLDAVAVHGGGGIWGLIAAPLLAANSGIVYMWDKPSAMNLAWNMIGALAIIAWSGIISVVMFGVLRAMKILRVSEDIERKGMDVIKHGEPAYPYQSYGDGWEEESSDSDDSEDGGVNNGKRPHRHPVMANMHNVPPPYLHPPTKAQSQRAPPRKAPAPAANTMPYMVRGAGGQPYIISSQRL